MKINDRVGAVCSSTEETVTIFGFGVYEGNFIPETNDIIVMGMSLKELNIPNPRIKLDNGEIVWGAECWWGDEDEVKEHIQNKKIINILPSEYRNMNQDDTY